MCNGNTTPLSSPRGARAWDVLPSFVSCIHLISFPSHRKHHEAFLFQIHQAGADLCAGIGWRSCCCGWGWERSIQEPSRISWDSQHSQVGPGLSLHPHSCPEPDPGRADPAPRGHQSSRVPEPGCGTGKPKPVWEHKLPTLEKGWLRVVLSPHKYFKGWCQEEGARLSVVPNHSTIGNNLKHVKFQLNT